MAATPRSLPTDASLISPAPSLPLTGERTLPGIDQENYWFRRHEVAYRWITEHVSVAHYDLLEAGCGEGYGADILQRAGARVSAVDYDAAAIAHASRTYPAVKAQVGNLAELGMPAESQDVVVSLQVIEHLWDLSDFLSDLRRILHPGGTVVLSTPNRLTFSPGIARGEKPTNPFHVEEFDGEQLAELLAAAGFGEIEMYGISHSSGLLAREEESGSIVERQVSAILSQDWPQGLQADVAAITVADFEVAPHRDDALDLLAVARA